MDQVSQALWAGLAAALTALVPLVVRVVVRGAELLGERALAEVQARLGAGAARVAGELAAELRASPTLQAVSQAAIDRGAEALRARFADTVEKRGVPVDVLRGMVMGELGKLGVAVSRR